MLRTAGYFDLGPKLLLQDFGSRARIFGAAIAALAIVTVQDPSFALAQDATQQATAPQAAATQPELLSAEDLEALVARIALYPDDLVALVLAGSLYPLQVVQAQRYLDDVKSKPDLKPNADWRRGADAYKQIAVLVAHSQGRPRRAPTRTLEGIRVGEPAG